MTMQTVYAGNPVLREHRLGVVQRVEGPKPTPGGRTRYLITLKSDNIPYQVDENQFSFHGLKQTHRGDVVEFDVVGQQEGRKVAVAFVNKTVANLVRPA